MKIIFGLGNPGKEYENTRHNTGFFVLDKIREKYNFPEFEFNKKFNAEISKNNEFILVKPQTFMNLSGAAVKNILDFYKLTADNITVIHDDIDLPIGKYKIAVDSSSAGHNGVQNIIEALGTQKFRRIRIGIKPECDIKDASDFVLQKFTPEEIEIIEKQAEEIEKELLQ